MTLTELVGIASRYFTAMADAMVAACVAKALETGEYLEIPERGPSKKRGEGPEPEPAWKLMVEGNTDTRWMHV